MRQQQQPGDEQQTWPREQLTEMDLQFCEAMERALAAAASGGQARA